jgi:hypothetical protein
MKIRITKKGLPKAQALYSQMGRGFFPMQTPPSAQASIPQVNEKRVMFNTLLGIQPSLSIPQDGVQISLPKQAEQSLTWQPLEQQAAPVNPQASSQPLYKVEQKPVDRKDMLDPNKNPIFDDWDNLQKTFETGSARDFRKARKSFNDTYDVNLKDNRLIRFGAEGRETVAAIDKAGDAIKGLVGVTSGITDMFRNARRDKEFNRYLRNQQNTDSLYKPVEGSRGDYVVTGSRFGEFRPDDYVVNRGMFAEYGGENNETMKIRITGAPATMAYGGQADYGLDLGRRKVYTDMPETKSESVSNTISSVPREAANVEAEGGETVYGDLDGDGGMEHMKITGPRHSQGGVPLNLPEGSFIFSDTAKMRIKDPEVLEYFGLSEKKGGYTPAEIAKKYNINKYKAVLEDKTSDELDKNTAQLMIKNYNEKLAYLAMVQESMKGFPQGVPEVAQSQEAEYGGYVLPQAQNGRQQPKDDVIFTPEIQQILADLRDSQGIETIYSPRILSGDNRVPLNQPKQKSGLYGDVRMDEIDEFKKRHEWYFKNKPNWNPASENDVLDFQTKYDEEYAKKYGYSYFTGKRKFDKKDKKLGEYTYNAPPVLKSEKPVEYFACDPNGGGVIQLNPNNPALKYQAGVFTSYAAAQAACTSKPKEKNPPEEEQVKPNEPEFRNEKLPFGYMTPDLVNLAAAALVPPKKYLPYRAPINLPRVSPTFYDPNREIAAQNETANILSQNAAMFANPQAYMANAARLQGNLAEGVANTMSRTQNQNVGVANQFAGINADIIGKENMLNAQRANDLYDGNVIANQQFDNSRRLYNQNLARSFAQAWNNRMSLGMINAVNPMYRVDPASGRSYFVRGYNPNMLGRGSATGAGSMAGRSFIDLKNQFLKEGYSDSLAERKADQLFSGARGTTSYLDNNMDGFPDRASYSMAAQNMLPYFAAMQRFLPQAPGMQQGF